MKILLVEDEYSLSEALSASLKKENYVVDVAFDGETGLYNALTGIYDLIILDIMLPKIDGLQVLKQIRKNNIKSVVLLLTAKSEVQDKVEGLDLGADDYLTKPFYTKELLARVRALIRRKTDVDNNEIIYKDMVLDIKKCEIGNANTGESVKLGPKEFQILEFLMVNSKQIVSKEKITEKIWGFESDAEYNNVEVYISFIRRKIAFIESEVKIKAIRGIGYILEE